MRQFLTVSLVLLSCCSSAFAETGYSCSYVGTQLQYSYGYNRERSFTGGEGIQYENESLHLDVVSTEWTKMLALKALRDQICDNLRDGNWYPGNAGCTRVNGRDFLATIVTPSRKRPMQIKDGKIENLEAADIFNKQAIDAFLAVNAKCERFRAYHHY